PPIPTDEFEKNELLRLEKEALGLYVSEHPLSAIRDQLRKKCDTPLAELDRRRDGEIVTVGGIVSQLKALLEHPARVEVQVHDHPRQVVLERVERDVADVLRAADGPPGDPLVRDHLRDLGDD